MKHARFQMLAITAVFTLLVRPVFSGTGHSPQGDVAIAIFRNSQNITGTTRSVFVGERIALEVRTIPANRVLQQVSWSVPGERIRNWQANSEYSVLTEMAPADFNNNSIVFYWVDGADKRTVRCTATIAGATYEAWARFNVDRPNPHVEIATGSIGLRDFDYYGIHYGSWNKPGFEATRGAFGMLGLGCWVQTVNPVRRIQDENGNWQRWSGGAGLDRNFPYTSMARMSDSPGQGLPNHVHEAEVSDNFQTYLMFKPNTPNAIWVPIKKIEWSWGATATRVSEGNNWTLTSISKPAPSVSTTFEFPSWSRMVTNNYWDYE